MSAFIVSEKTMHRVVHAMMPQDAPCEACDEMGRQLYRLNAEAVKHRYSHRSPEEVGAAGDFSGYKYAVIFPPLIQQFTSLSCLIYQCSEGKVPETPLYQTLKRRQISLAIEIVCNLAEYRQAEWD
jgi:hypothetical protein